MRRAGTLLALTALARVCTTEARAQSFTDDFETGTLLTSDTPPGPWPNGAEVANVSFLPAAVAAHRGQFGALLSDRAGGAGQGGGSKVFGSFGSGVNYEALYFRFWVRALTALAPGEFSFWGTSGNTPITTVLELYASSDGGIYLQGWDRTSTRQRGPTLSYPVGQWMLIEVDVLGLGTDAGEARYFFDGVRHDLVPVDWSGIYVDGQDIGEHWSDLSYQGDYYLDDLRTSTAPPAERLVLSAAADGGVAGDCITLSVELLDALGASAPAPYGVAPLLSASLDGGFFSDPACTQQGPVIIAQGATQQGFSFRAQDPGTLTLAASHVDFLGMPTLTLSIAPGDAGPRADAESGNPETLRVGCNCSHGVKASIAGLALLALAARRRAGS
jgi:hypothetical protein